MFIQFPLDSFKGLGQAASNLGTVLALGAAAFWFFRTSKSKQRIQFDLGCKAYALANNLNEKIAEIQFCFETRASLNIASIT